MLAFAHALKLSELPAGVVDRARDCLRDALGCGIFGSGQVWSRILADEMLAEAATAPLSGVSNRCRRRRQRFATAPRSMALSWTI
jgi:2-methylcitrate dehydratase PrpD